MQKFKTFANSKPYIAETLAILRVLKRKLKNVRGIFK